MAGTAACGWPRSPRSRPRRAAADATGVRRRRHRGRRAPCACRSNCGTSGRVRQVRHWSVRPHAQRLQESGEYRLRPHHGSAGPEQLGVEHAVRVILPQPMGHVHGESGLAGAGRTDDQPYWDGRVALRADAAHEGGHQVVAADQRWHVERQLVGWVVLGDGADRGDAVGRRVERRVPRTGSPAGACAVRPMVPGRVPWRGRPASADIAAMPRIAYRLGRGRGSAWRKTLVGGLLGDQSGQFADQFGVPPQLQVDLDPVAEGDLAQLLHAHDLGLQQRTRADPLRARPDHMPSAWRSVFAAVSSWPALNWFWPSVVSRSKRSASIVPLGMERR